MHLKEDQRIAATDQGPLRGKWSWEVSDGLERGPDVATLRGAYDTPNLESHRK